MKKSLITRVIALGSVVALAAACGTADRETPETPESTDQYSVGYKNVEPNPGEPTNGGTFSMVMLSEPTMLDPARYPATGSSGGSELSAIYDVLIRYDVEAQEYVPHLAEALESNEDLTQWTLTLRPDVTFSDGTPFDANAVKASLERYVSLSGYGTGYISTALDTIEAPDDRTVVLNLKKPWSGIPTILAQGPGMIVAPAAYADDANFTPIGAGPFTFNRYAPQEELLLDAREDYWDGRPHLDQVRFTWALDDNRKLESLAANEVNAAYVYGPVGVDKAIEDGYPGYMNIVSLGSQITINLAEGRPGEDKRVREAIALASDPELYIQRGSNGSGLVERNVMSQRSRWFSGGDAPEQNVERARELVEEAKADGFDGKLTFVGPISAEQQGLALKAMLDQVGFEVTLDLQRTGTDVFRKISVDREFDIATAGQSIPDADPFPGLFNYLHSQSPSNPSGYASDEMDAALDQLQGAANDDERQTALTELERVWWEEIPAVPLLAAARYVVWQDNVHGVVVTDSDMVLLNKAWIKN